MACAPCGTSAPCGPTPRSWAWPPEPRTRSSTSPATPGRSSPPTATSAPATGSRRRRCRCWCSPRTWPRSSSTPTAWSSSTWTAGRLRYPDDTFDGIFSSGSIEHFGDLQDVANAAYEMGRVLKPGGVLGPVHRVPPRRAAGRDRLARTHPAALGREPAALHRRGQRAGAGRRAAASTCRRPRWPRPAT